MKLAKVLTLFMALILAFVFISAPVANSGGGTSDKHPWDEDTVGSNDDDGGGYLDYVGITPSGDNDLDDPDAGTYSTGVIWFFQNIDFRFISQTITLYKGVTVDNNRGQANTGLENVSVK